VPNSENPLYSQAEYVLKELADLEARLRAAGRGGDADEALRAREAARAELEREWGGVPPFDIVYYSSDPAVSSLQSELKEMLGEASDGAVRSTISEETFAAPEGAAARSTTRGGGLSGLIGALKKVREAVIDRADEPPAEAPPVAQAIGNRVRVALVGDWAAKTDGSRNVAARIAALRPDHVVHLGDVYPTGEQREIDEFFIRRWAPFLLRVGNSTAAGPGGVRRWAAGGQVRFWAIPGNHEQYARGLVPPYYQGQGVLGWCSQPASYFALQNDRWKLIALDTGWKDHDLTRRQVEWLRGELDGAGSRRVILLTHHQLFSLFDDRPAREGGGLRASWERVYDPTRHDVAGWFAGHEHNVVLYEPGTGKAPFPVRSIGHGGRDIALRNGTFAQDAVPAAHRAEYARAFELPAPIRTKTVDGRLLAQNGFALLSFDDEALTIRYLGEGEAPGEFGDVWLTEAWRAA
jgi:hypothetical protein